jgi:hypothetical protein
LRTYDPNSYAQQAITFLCLDFNGVTTRHNSLPAKFCPSGVRAQVVRVHGLALNPPILTYDDNRTSQAVGTARSVDFDITISSSDTTCCLVNRTSILRITNRTLRSYPVGQTRAPAVTPSTLSPCLASSSRSVDRYLYLVKSY